MLYNGIVKNSFYNGVKKMYQYPIGVIVESFTGKTEDCIKKAAASARRAFRCI